MWRARSVLSQTLSAAHVASFTSNDYRCATFSTVSEIEIVHFLSLKGLEETSVTLLSRKIAMEIEIRGVVLKIVTSNSLAHITTESFRYYAYNIAIFLRIPLSRSPETGNDNVKISIRPVSLHSKEGERKEKVEPGPTLDLLS